MSPEKVREVIDRCVRAGHLPDGSRGCLLCNDTCPDEPIYTGVFIANREHQRRIGCSKQRLANGGSRFVIYQLCPICFESPTRNEDVEKEIFRRVSVQ
jgi:hypothetical protein